MWHDRRSLSFYVLAGIFGLFVLFLYGPIATIVVLSFQGPQGGLTFPMQGLSVHWFLDLFQPQSIGDIWGAFGRSCVLGLLVMVCTVVFSFLAGLAFRTSFRVVAVVQCSIWLWPASLCRRSSLAWASVPCSNCAD